MPSKKNAWLIPAVLTPPNRRCVVIYVPDDRDHYAAFWGALVPLAQWNNWERDDNHSGKILASVWRDVIEEAWDRFIDGECCPDVPPPAPPPVPPPVPPLLPSGSGDYEGTLGLSVYELEGLLAMSVVDVDVRDGILYVKYFGCCDWVAKGNITALIQDTNSGIGQAVPDAIASGLINSVSPQKLAKPTETVLNNASTNQCRKATAMKWVLITYLSDLSEYAESMSNDLQAILSGLSIALGAMGLGELIPISELSDLLVDLGVDEVVDAANALIADTQFWDDFVCDLSADMSSIDSVTGQDISAYWTYFNLQAAILGEIILSVTSKFSLSQFQANVASVAGYSGCECSDYLPAGYIPPSQSGSIQFGGLINTGAIADAPLAYLAGQPFELIQYSNPHGQVIQTNQQWRTVYSGTDTAYGQNNKYTRLGIVLIMPELLTVDSILYDLDIVGTPAGAVWQAEQVWMSRYLPGTGWGGGTLHNERALTDATDISGNLNSAVCTYLALSWRTVNTDENLYAVISNLRFTGTINGQGFLNKMIGEPLT